MEPDVYYRLTDEENRGKIVGEFIMDDNSIQWGIYSLKDEGYRVFGELGNDFGDQYLDEDGIKYGMYEELSYNEVRPYIDPEFYFVSKAFEIAVRAHDGQTDKGGAPYINHVLYVASQMRTDEERATALLHDVIEDTDWTFGDLADEDWGIPTAVYDAVKLLTKQDRKEDYFKYLARLKPNPIARAVKLGDLKNNSDLSRLKEVTPRDEKRVEQYKKAIEFLNN